MKKTKRLLSALTALTITASAFAGMVIPASATDDDSLYTLDLSSATSGNVITAALTEDELSSKSVADFGTTVTQLDGWGYQHWGVTGTNFTTGRQTTASVDATNNIFTVVGIGNSGCNAGISFIPANVDSVEIPTSGVLVYTFDAIATHLGHSASPTIGFTKGTGSSIDSVASVELPTAETKNSSNTYKMTLIENVATGAYSIYKDGIQGASGTSTDITGIYAQTLSNKNISIGIKDLVLKKAQTAPDAVKVTFNGDGNTAIQTYDSVLVGTTLAAPDAPSVAGKLFKGWKNGDGETVTTFTAGDEDTVYTAVYETAPIGDVTVTSNGYAKVTLKQDGKDDKILYTDATGAAKWTGIDNGDYTYTIEKQGYTSKTDGSFKLTSEGYTISDKLSLTENEDHDYFYYEKDFANGAGKAGFTAAADRAAEIPLETMNLETVSDIFVDFDFTAAEAGQVTWQFLNSSSKVVVGIQAVTNDLVNDDGDTVVEAGLYAFTGWSGNSGLNQSSDVGAYTQGVKIADSYVGTKTVELIIDKSAKTITAKCGDETGTLTLIEDASTIAKIKGGKYQTKTTAFITGITAETPDTNFVQVNGDTKFAKIAGKTVTRQFTAAPGVPVAGEEFTWKAVDKTTGEAVTGVTIDENGLLSLTDALTADATVTVTATSKTTPTKTGSVDVTIKATSTLTATIEGAKNVAVGDTATYKVTKIVDDCDDDVTEFFTPVWSIDGAPSTDTSVTFDVTGKSGAATAIIASYDGNNVLESVSTEDVTIAEGDTSLNVSAPAGSKVMLWDTLSGMKPISDEVKTAPAVTIPAETVATVGSKTGKVTTYNTGNVALKVKLGTQTETYSVKVGTYSIVEDYNSQSTVDISSITADDAITGYQVTVADADGNQLAQSTVAKAEVTGTAVTVPAASSGTPAKVEVAPVYELTSIPATDTRGTFAIPAGTYNFTVAMSGERADIYVNDQLIINNMLQYGSSATDTVNDIVVSEGTAVMNTKDYSSGKTAANSTISSIKVVKAPSIVTRKTKMYVLGDSLVAKYYNGGSAENNLLQTGWGQVLQNYVTDDIEVVDIANSGITANGLLGTAFTQVLASAESGDYMILESGYNDKTYDTEAIMKNALKTMVSQAKAKGVNVILVSPNTSHHDLTPTLKFTTTMEEVAQETSTKYIDLAQLSYDFLTTTYNSTAFTADGDASTSGEQVNDLSKFWNVADRLHSTFNGANKWASVVAQGLYDLGYTSIVNTTYTYSFTDGLSATITCKVTPAAN